MEDPSSPGLYFGLNDGRVWAMAVTQNGDSEVSQGERRDLGDANDEMALCYDPADGTAQKIGPVAAVRDYMELLQAAFCQEAVEFQVVSFQPTEETLAALSDCWNCSGSANRFVARLPELQMAASPAGPRH